MCEEKVDDFEKLLSIFGVECMSKLVDIFGDDFTIGELLKIVQADAGHVCPKCEGKGYIDEREEQVVRNFRGDVVIKYVTFKKEPCDLCLGLGRTAEKYRPKMVQDGWEIDK